MPASSDQPSAEASARAVRALDLLLAETGRDRTGAVTDPAEWAAVVGVERVALVAGTTDPGRLRLLLQEDGDEAARARARVEEALERSPRDRGPDSGTAHREAGHHSVTTDAVRLRAALRAAHRTFEHEPYYRARYAERGARFAGTDSAWLVSLADLPVDGCLGQVSWLARVLGNRGMPSWLLERHLRDLVVELEDAAGPGAAGSLVDAAVHLADTRRRVVSDGDLAVAAEELRVATGEEEPLPGAAALVLAAAADAVTGTAQGYESCVGWLTDPERCTPAAASWLQGRAATIAPGADSGAGASAGAGAGSSAALSAGTSRGGSPAPRS